MKGRKTKRYAVLMLVLMEMLLFLPAGQAISVAEWNRSCTKKTQNATPVYATTDPYIQSSHVISIPTNTYVKVISAADGISLIDYMTYNGQRGMGYVRSYDLGSAMISYTDAGGNRKTMHELVYQDKYGFIPGNRDAGYLPDETGDEEKKPSDNKPSSSAGSTKATAKTEAVIVRYGDDAVQLVRLGVVTSTIMLNGEEKEIPTAELEFGSTAEKEKQVAVIHAPKTGTCTLRAKAAEKGKMLKKCKAGTVVAVMEYGSKWCKIRYKGTVGYVQTGCLKWYETKEVTDGRLSYNGKTTGRTTINVRNTPSGDSAKIAEWPTGTLVEVFGLEKGWYEIEYDGIHGFVMEKFLTAE